MPDPITVEPYDPAWPGRFRELAGSLRAELGDLALRIDHIGSTSVPGLAAKPVIDILISRAALEPVAAYAPGLERAGFHWRADNADRLHRYFRETPGMARTHIHVYEAGSWSEQLNLLFRDFLRADSDARRLYAETKIELAVRFRDDRSGYVDAKAPTVWALLRRAHEWAQMVGWSPGPSDA